MEGIANQHGELVRWRGGTAPPQETISEGEQISNAQYQRDRMVAKVETVVPRKRKRPEVLEEDEYTAAVAKIIERDFFPDLAKSKMQAEWLKAVQSDDPKQIWETQRRIVSQLRPDLTPGQTPLGTPMRGEFKGVKDNGDVSDKTRNMSLDKFMTKYTSEDNAAFEVIFEKHLKEQHKKIRVATRRDNRITSNWQWGGV